MISNQTKSDLKKKKKIIALLNHISSIDETVINFYGDKNDCFFLIIQDSFERALSGKSNLCNEIYKMKGLSGRKFRVLLNELIKNFSNPNYLEIGSWLGSTACSACFNNDLQITCIDNWSQNFDLNTKPREVFHSNIRKFLSKKSNFKIIEKDFREVNFKIMSGFNIYFYDGGHHYEDHFDAIKFALPSLSNKFILIVDDWNWNQVRKGTFDSIEKQNLNVISCLEIRTTKDGSSSLITGENSDWHQGCAFFVLKK